MRAVHPLVGTYELQKGVEPELNKVSLMRPVGSHSHANDPALDMRRSSLYGVDGETKTGGVVLTTAITNVPENCCFKIYLPRATRHFDRLSLVKSSLACR